MFLARVFNKLLINFTWWVNRKDADGKNLFAGGFLGLDNIGVFDRSKPLPTGGDLEQADGTAWMAFYCATMLEIALELAKDDPAYEDMAVKFFEHFVAIADAMNTLGGEGLWDEEDGFYYDQLHADGQHIPLKVRSMVGIIPLFAVVRARAGDHGEAARLLKRMEWFLENRTDLPATSPTWPGHLRHAAAIGSWPSPRASGSCACCVTCSTRTSSSLLRDPLALQGPRRRTPTSSRSGHDEYRVDYVPGESNTGLFGGNSNWRGPVWFPVNYLLIEALRELPLLLRRLAEGGVPDRLGELMNLGEVADEIARRLTALFIPDKEGHRPSHGRDPRYASDPAWKDLVLFYEYFDGDDGRGLGASHQTGWTALVTRCLEILTGPAAQAGK